MARADFQPTQAACEAGPVGVGPNRRAHAAGLRVREQIPAPLGPKAGEGPACVSATVGRPGAFGEGVAELLVSRIPLLLSLFVLLRAAPLAVG